MSSEEAKRSINGALMAVKPKTDDPKLSPESTTSPTKKVIIKSADMKEEQQKEAVNIAISVTSLFSSFPQIFHFSARFRFDFAFEKNNVEKDVAERIKKEFDKRHGPTWHCIIGRNFGSYVTHETNHFVYFYLDQKAVLLFKSG
ncbi:dynein light chain-like [Gossypium australe]|uniref:Dynein light chain n=1 Tax=Gossypium australe TaxID=47621 RepID=A0A5B6UHB5_9ROSI|nr:dynein light chain-like [Gossypium australe]